MRKELPIRNHPRLKEYDYSQNGYYFITINTEKNLPILSTVGRGLAPAETNVKLTSMRKIVEEQLIALEERYKNIQIHKYVIMPTHIHAIIIIENQAAGAPPRGPSLAPSEQFTLSPRPTLMDIICAYKSLTTRLCNIKDCIEGRKIWQTSFFDRIIRNEQEYLNTWQYIDENPAKWEEDKYYRKQEI
jgi:REP element-mobilizing transposase RayT